MYSKNLIKGTPFLGSVKATYIAEPCTLSYPSTKSYSNDMASSSTTPQNPDMDKINALVRSPQFFWWLGHGTVLFSALGYFATLFWFPSLYKLAYLGAITSYAIVLYMTHKSFSFTMQYAARLVSDENFSYGFLAFYWLLLDPIAVTLIPFTLFTVIHYVSYFRNQLLPALYPQVPKELKTRASPPSKQAQVALMLDDLTRRYAAPAIRMATMSEVTLVPVVLILLALTFRISFVSLFFYGQFLRQRALQSAQTRNAFSEVAATLDVYVLQPKVPGAVQNLYTTIKGYMASSIQLTPSPQRAN
ncbi:Transmembrane nucleoporin [Entomophthora muscae]|uniref:Transmembrane nucleoporin n=1 Tax=Entomophthora muscae TaxID=34485 RepID=A0ACC2RTW9_9FUNG|nr:Transmembrane nucleoporin [Entomophthora muscae]